jgi:hypothetical protein
MGETNQSTVNRMQNIDPRYIYLIFIIIVMALMAFPVNIPTPVTQATIDAHEYIKSMAPGSKVLFCQTYPAGAKAEQLPQATVLAKALIDQGCVLIGMSIREDGPVLDNWAWTQAVGQAKYDELYGNQLVIIGFIPGRESAVKALAADMRMTETDVYGTPLDELPAMEGVLTAEDLDAICIVSGSMGWVNFYLRQIQVQFGTPFICGIQASAYTQMLPYIPETIKAYILGLRGAREFEKVISPGQPLYVPNLQGMMDALSSGFFYIVILIIATNVLYYLSRSQNGGS